MTPEEVLIRKRADDDVSGKPLATLDKSPAMAHHWHSGLAPSEHKTLETENNAINLEIAKNRESGSSTHVHYILRTLFPQRNSSCCGIPGRDRSIQRRLDLNRSPTMHR